MSNGSRWLKKMVALGFLAVSLSIAPSDHVLNLQGFPLLGIWLHCVNAHLNVPYQQTA